MSLLQKTIKLKTFLGKIKDKNTSEENNYWKLINETGEIIEELNKNFPDRVLVLFNRNLEEFNLANHNPIKNSLWILISDLEII